MHVWLTLLLFAAQAGGFPSASAVSWMEPAAFHLRIGMSRQEAVRIIERGGWETEAAKNSNNLVLVYDSGKTATLSFRDDQLVSIRFELVDFIGGVRNAFSELAARMRKEHGKPSAARDQILIYDQTQPRIYIVLSTDPTTSFGVQGLGFLAVRYFVPGDAEGEATSAATDTRSGS